MSLLQHSIFESTPRVASQAETVEDGRATDFEAAALPHFNELMRTASRLMGSRTEAEDLLQETYCQAWKSFHRFELGTNCRAWLFCILLNKARHHRQRLLWKKTHDCEMKLVETLSFNPSVNEQLEDEEIICALERLPQCYCDVVLPVDVEEFSYREVAGILGIPIGTVMSRLSRGRKLLRVELADVAKSYGIKGRLSLPAVKTPTSTITNPARCVSA